MKYKSEIKNKEFCSKVSEEKVNEEKVLEKVLENIFEISCEHIRDLKNLSINEKTFDLELFLNFIESELQKNIEANVLENMINSLIFTTFLYKLYKEKFIKKYII